MVSRGLVSAASYVLVCDGLHGSIRLEAKVHDDFVAATSGEDKDSKKRRVHLARYFQEFCDHPDFAQRLPKEKLRREDSLKDGRGGHVGVWAFKARHIRVYGIILNVDGKRCFAGTAIDTSKKQDEADQAILRSAAQRGGSLIEYK